MIENILSKVGLSEKEIKVYKALLIMHKSSVTVLGNRIKLNRDVTRYTCQQLVKKGLVQEKKNGNAFFYHVNPPESLSSRLEEKKAEISHQHIMVKKFMGIFQALQNPMINCPDIEYFEGRDGIIEIYEDILKTGKNVYCWTNFEKKGEILGDEYMENYIQRRILKNITVHTIEENLSNTKIQQQEKAKYENLQCRISFVDILPIKNGEVRIYGEKVAIIVFKQIKPIAFVLRNQEIADIFQAIYQGFWKLSNRN